MIEVNYDNVNEVIANLMSMTKGKTITEVAKYIKDNFDRDSRWYLASRLEVREGCWDIALEICARYARSLAPMNVEGGSYILTNDRIIFTYIK